MNTETMIRQLNAVAEKHKNDFVPTFQTNISAMCRDIIPKLEQLAEYEKIGTVEEIESITFNSNQLRLVNLVEEYKEKLKEYEEIGTEECPRAKEIQRQEKSALKRVIDYFSKLMENAEDLMNHVKEQVNNHPGNYPCEYNLADIEESRYKTLCEVMSYLLEVCKNSERKD